MSTEPGADCPANRKLHCKWECREWLICIRTWVASQARILTMNFTRDGCNTGFSNLFSGRMRRKKCRLNLYFVMKKRKHWPKNQLSCVTNYCLTITRWPSKTTSLGHL